MSIKNKLQETLIVLDVEQKKQFFEYIPKKVYKTERNISFLVALTQVCMILIFLFGNQKAFQSTRGIQYFSLYVFLLVSTSVAIFLYRYTTRAHKLTAFLWIRRIFATVICIWVMCITLLEGASGKGITVYCYLMPTMAAVLLLTPLEGFLLFGGTWIVLIVTFFSTANEAMFSNTINSTFVTVLTLFISFRYYRSMAVEFLDRETISSQYQEIESSNELLQKMVHVDQLTNLFNRHYMIEKLYPTFDECKEKSYYGMFLMIDIDYFKQYNDSYGHIKGDECLKSLAKVIKKVCTEYKIAPIRYGGEEFLLIKIDKEPFNHRKFSEYLLDEIRLENIERDDVVFNRVTVSGGLWYGNLDAIAHIELGIKQADEALYKAKTSGRNRMIITEL